MTLYDFKAGFSLEGPDLTLYGEDALMPDIAANVAKIVGEALEDAGFTVVSLTAKGGPRATKATARFTPAQDVDLAPEMDEDDNGAVLGA